MLNILFHLEKMLVDNSNYKSQGLIEAVIAIAIVAMAALVFLQISSDSIVTLNSIVKTDQLIKVSSENSQKLRKISEIENKDKSSDIFPNPSTSIGQCFEMEGNLENPRFANNGTSVCNLSNIEECRNRVTSGDNIFSVYCITTASDTNLVIGKIITGLKECAKKEDNTCKIADTTYTVIVYVENNDRKVCNFNKICELSKGEDSNNCLDCVGGQQTNCNNNSLCEPLLSEIFSTCPSDCHCGNGICESNYGESAFTCSNDCYVVSHCGNGVCEAAFSENVSTCLSDCHCGNGICEVAFSENVSNCNQDCAIIPTPVVCQSICTELSLKPENKCLKTEQICTPPRQCISIKLFYKGRVIGIHPRCID